MCLSCLSCLSIVKEDSLLQAFFCTAVTAGLMESAPRPGSAPAVSERLGSIRLDSVGSERSKDPKDHPSTREYPRNVGISKLIQDSKRFQDHLLGLTGYGSAKSNEITLCDSEISQIFTAALAAKLVSPVASGCIRLH